MKVSGEVAADGGALDNRRLDPSPPVPVAVGVHLQFLRAAAVAAVVVVVENGEVAWAVRYRWAIPPEASVQCNANEK